MVGKICQRKQSMDCDKIRLSTMLTLKYDRMRLRCKLPSRRRTAQKMVAPLHLLQYASSNHPWAWHQLQWAHGPSLSLGRFEQVSTKCSSHLERGKRLEYPREWAARAPPLLLRVAWLPSPDHRSPAPQLVWQVALSRLSQDDQQEQRMVYRV
jgi:hypothetical protein